MINLRIWLLGRRFVHKYSHMMYFIKKSFVYGFIRMMILTIGILWIAFILMPRDAFIDISSDEASNEFSFVTDLIDSEYVVTQYTLTVNSDTEISFIANGGCITDDQTYDINKKLKLLVSPGSEPQKLEIFIQSRDDFGISIFTYKRSDRITLGTDDDIIFNDLHIALEAINISADHLVSSPIIILSRAGNVDVSIDDQIKSSDSQIMLIPEQGRLSMNIKSRGLLKMNFDPIAANIEMNDISKAKVKCKGNLDFSYTPNATSYKVNNQVIQFDSSRSLLNASIEIRNNNTNHIQISGKVNEASISGLDLFPSFQGWYRTNAYLIPLTVITTIIGGLAQMIIKRK